MNESEILLTTNLPGVPLLVRGKVRDVYELPDDKLLIVATDRISAYDVVMPNGIPGKGVLLNQMSLFWFSHTRELVANHVITGNFGDYPRELQPFEDQLAGRSMLVQKALRVPFECVVRGYLSGSGWRDYQRSGKVCGIELPPDLRESERLAEPIFTPATKAEQGHDENVPFGVMTKNLGEGLAHGLRRFSIAVYEKARTYAEARGIIIADTKLEFGMTPGGLRLIDEIFTPDSSRFWPKDDYEPGRPQNSFDKQFLRDWLDSIGWDRQPPVPVLPYDIVENTAAKYRKAYEWLIG
jgi:phosphoribosylaminoimidazole-succinocarboxamide synthase